MTGRSVQRVGAALVGALIGAGVVLAWGDVGDDARSPEIEEPPVRTLPTPAPETEATSGGAVLLAWAPGSLPPQAERVVEGVGKVDDATTVVAALDWITSTIDANGGRLDHPRPGYGIPFDVASVEPSEYAGFVPPGEADLVAALGPGEMLLSRTAAHLRGGGMGMRVRTRAGSWRVVGVISDEASQGYEGLVAQPVPTGWGRTYRFVLVRVGALTARDVVDRRLRRLLGGTTPLRVRAFGETPFLRYGDAVLPPLVVKDTFGEFAARPAAGGSIAIDPVWQRENIVSATVPVLGRVTCHRLLIRQVRDALRDLESSGLADRVDPSQFAGCFNARFIGRDPEGRLSHHSWGIALDLNSLENPTGAEPRLDRDIVEAFERHGFTWGGRWLVPDGMHFEWVRFP